MIVILIIGLVLTDTVCSLPLPPTTALSKDLLISSVQTVYGKRFITLNNPNINTWVQRFFQISRLIKNSRKTSMEFQAIFKSTSRRHIHKRFAPSYPQYCHFKICNMGKGSRYFRTIDKKFKKT